MNFGSEEQKKEGAWEAPSVWRAGDGTRTRDSLLGKQETIQIGFLSAFMSHLSSERTCSPLAGGGYA